MKTKQIVKSVVNGVLNAKWMEGKVTIPYNLRWLILALLVIVALPFLVLYGLWWLMLTVCDYLWQALKAIWMWLLPLLVALWLWLKGLFTRKPKVAARQEKPRNWRWLWWLLAALLALLLLWLCRDCSCSGREEEPIDEEVVVTPELAWSDVMVYRIHLDTLRNDAHLIGLKTRGNKRAEEVAFNGDALGESEEVVENEWTVLVRENVHIKLSRPQMAGTILYAMRCGKNGFKKSDFLKSLNEGNLAKASENITRLHDYKGRARVNGREATRYLYELRLIFDGNLSVEEVLDCHRLSYLLYPADKGYEPEAIKKVIQTKARQNMTVREIIAKAEAEAE